MGNLEDDDAWNLCRPDLSWEIWRLWKSFDFQVSLWDGGILSWPDWFIHDAMIFNWLNRMVRRDIGMKD